MTTLSPAAQAVINAAHQQPAFNPDGCPNLAGSVAAALRAVVKSCMYMDDYGFHYIDSDKILGIAAEMEAQL